MALSGMSSRERTLVIVLGVIIVLALVGIGLLAARLIASDEDGQQAGGITPAATTAGPAATPQASATLVENPPLEEASEATPAPVAEEPVAVAQVESQGAVLPAIITSQPLHAGHRYRIEIAALDGSRVAVKGSWSQSARGAGGELELPLPESIEGQTPLTIEVQPPLENPASWRVSVSAAPKDLLGQPPKLVVTIWDVTGQ